MVQDRPLEILEGLRGLNAELADQRAASLLVRLERFGLAACPVEGEHQLGSEAFAKLMLARDCFELADQLKMVAEREVGFEPSLQRHQPKLFEPRTRCRRKRSLSKFREWLATPQLERLAKSRSCSLFLAGRRRPLAASKKRLEPMEIKLVVLQLDHVPRVARANQRRSSCGPRETLTQLRDALV